MTVVLHLSDPHFGTEQPKVADALVALSESERPDLAILSGDITQRALRAEFRAARAFVDRLGARALLALPGNHDIPLFDIVARLRAPYARYREAFGEELAPVFESEALLVVGVDATRRHRHKHGVVSREQVERAGDRLRRATARQLRLVVTHQPVHVRTAGEEKNLLRGNVQAVTAWSAAGADLILGGHIHLPYVSPLSERAPSLSRRTWCVQAGTAVSSRVRDGIPNSVNLIRYPDQGAASCLVERWDFHSESLRFTRVAVHQLELDRALGYSDSPAPHVGPPGVRARTS